jgi:hypothetical protein
MPVILKTQKSFQKLSPWSNFTFPNEISQSAEVKAPKFQVKYNLVKRNSQRDPVASVFEPTNYVPLVVQQFQVKAEPQPVEPQVEMETEPQVEMEVNMETFPESQIIGKKRKGSILQSTRKGKAPVQGMFVPPEIYFPPREKRKGSNLESTRKGKAPVQGMFVPPYSIGRPVDYLARPGIYLEQRPPQYASSPPEYESKLKRKGPILEKVGKKLKKGVNSRPGVSSNVRKPSISKENIIKGKRRR